MKKNKSLLFGALMILVTSVSIISCKKREFDTPPIKELPTGNVLTMSQLRARFNDTTGAPVRFNEDLSVYGVVTMDDKSGNIYKAAFVQDRTAGINLRLLSSGGLYVGDSVRIFLKGTVLSKYNGMLQLDSVDVDNNVVKQKSAVNFAPEVTTIDQITTATQSRLVKLENVQFSCSDAGKTWANAATQSSENRYLVDCNGKTILVRTSGYASFAGMKLPEGGGSVVAVVSVFNSDIQLYIRSIGEVMMNGPRCVNNPVSTLDEQFTGITVDNADLGITGWTNVAVKGSEKWSAQIYQSEKYAEATAYGSTEPTVETWLISPPINMTATKALSFQSAIAFSSTGHNPGSVWITQSFDGCDVNASTWTQVSATVASAANGNFTWVNSGVLPLAGYLPQGYTGNFHIGFKYVGSGPNGQTTNFRIDNVKITN
jgi:hypothetical protein